MQVRLRGFLLGEEICQRAFRAHVKQLDVLKVLFCFDGRCDCHEAVKATGVISAIFILCPVVHCFLAGLSDFKMLALKLDWTA